jgi:hypothetical protein
LTHVGEPIELEREKPAQACQNWQGAPPKSISEARRPIGLSLSRPSVCCQPGTTVLGNHKTGNANVTHR